MIAASDKRPGYTRAWLPGHRPRASVRPALGYIKLGLGSYTLRAAD